MGWRERDAGVLDELRGNVEPGPDAHAGSATSAPATLVARTVRREHRGDDGLLTPLMDGVPAHLPHFFPSGQRMRGRLDDRSRERWWSKSNQEKGHETFPKVSERNQAMVSTRRAQVLGVSSHEARGRGGVQTYRDHEGLSD